MKREHIIGVRVSETSIETRIVTDTVTPNSRNSRPTIPPIRNSGINTATSEEADRHDREADLTGPFDRRLHRAQPRFDAQHAEPVLLVVESHAPDEPSEDLGWRARPWRLRHRAMMKIQILDRYRDQAG